MPIHRPSEPLVCSLVCVFLEEPETVSCFYIFFLKLAGEHDVRIAGSGTVFGSKELPSNEETFAAKTFAAELKYARCVFLAQGHAWIPKYCLPCARRTVQFPGCYRLPLVCRSVSVGLDVRDWLKDEQV